jgi:uncharacterized membrane protein YhaH (DUF805 family)
MEYMFMPLKRYAEFSGRSRRMEYWMWFVFLFLLGIAFGVLMGVVGGVAMMSGGGVGALMAAGGGMMIVVLLYLLVCLALIIPNLAVTVRRLHDTNRSGKWLLGLIAAYVVMFIGSAMSASSPGTPGVGSILALVGGLATLGLGLTLLVFMFLEGTKGPNKYGADPKGGVDAQVFA